MKRLHHFRCQKLVNGNREETFLITDLTQRNNRSTSRQEKSWIRVPRIGFNFQDLNKLD